MATKPQKINKNPQNIRVFTRVRPISKQERRSHTVVECTNDKDVCVRDKLQTKTFSFDSVFGPESKQVDVYKAVVQPLLIEALQGYNCTVFAYGQTGTGKTYTMVGEKHDIAGNTWEKDPSAGIIPRTLNQLFDDLKVRGEEFTVRVSFLELYNEEMFDLLATNITDESKTLRLFEDPMKKGTVVVSGLEERTVHHKDDVYAVLETGTQRRQTAATLMNAQSSRSHTIFTITVHMKVTTAEGEELIKTGKLNLVDLAGSENIGRSGAVEMRAREAGSINQSLLTLGRVITALAERAPHVPYRESKLTRILQDSLGGRTKTSIIATVSPAVINMEETLSTLDYAHRAKNITNKPEINQKTSKIVLLRVYTEEIERLRRDLSLSREKQGVYLSLEIYNQLVNDKEQLNRDLVDKITAINTMEDELAKKENIVSSLNMDLDSTKVALETTEHELREKEANCERTQSILDTLKSQASVLLRTADESTKDNVKLHEKLDRTMTVEQKNMQSMENFKNTFAIVARKMSHQMTEWSSRHQSMVLANSRALNELGALIGNNGVSLSCVANNIRDQSGAAADSLKQQLEAFMQHLEQQCVLMKGAHENHQTLIKSSDDSNDSALSSLDMNLQTLEPMLKTSKETMQDMVTDIRSGVGWNEELHTLLTAELKNINKYITETDIEVKEVLSAREQILGLEETLKAKSDTLSQQEGELANRQRELLNQQKQLQVQMKQLQMQMEELQNQQNDLQTQQDDVRKYRNETMTSIDETRTTCRTLDQKLNELINRTNEQFMKHEKEVRTISMDNATKMITLGEKSNEYEMKVQATDEMFNIMRWLINWKSTMGTNLTNTSSALSAMWDTLIKEFNMTNDTARTQLHTVSEDMHTKHTAIQSELQQKLIDEQNTFQEEARQRVSEAVEDSSRLEGSLLERNKELSTQLEQRSVEVQTFFTEGIRQDVVTGQTPKRKNFDYPKQLVSVTPREHINNKLKDTVNRKRILDCVGDEFDNDSTLTNISMHSECMIMQGEEPIHDFNLHRSVSLNDINGLQDSTGSNENVRPSKLQKPGYRNQKPNNKFPRV